MNLSTNASLTPLEDSNSTIILYKIQSFQLFPLLLFRIFLNIVIPSTASTHSYHTTDIPSFSSIQRSQTQHPFTDVCLLDDKGRVCCFQRCRVVVYVWKRCGNKREIGFED